MEHYVTLFDALYLPQGLALHMSMERHVQAYSLWVLCVDEVTYSVLEKLALPNVRPLLLANLETEDLLRVKQERTRGEYCWTLTPFAPRFVFEQSGDIERVTYLDADLWFRKHPVSIFREFEASRKQVLITDHAYAPKYDHSAQSGQYCVQFMTFTRSGGEFVRKWWEEKCIDWCHAYLDNGRFGDQMYLDDWPERFADHVHVLAQQDLMQAPWNACRFPYSRGVVYHFQGLRLLHGKKVLLGPNNPMPKVTIEHVYKPYLDDFRAAVKMLEGLGLTVKSQATHPSRFSWLRAMLGRLYRDSFDYQMDRVYSLQGRS